MALFGNENVWEKQNACKIMGSHLMTCHDPGDSDTKDPTILAWWVQTSNRWWLSSEPDAFHGYVRI